MCPECNSKGKEEQCSFEDGWRPSWYLLLDLFSVPIMGGESQLYRVDLYLLTMTSEYDYFMVYNLTTNSYNYFEGRTIYFAYNVERDVLLIYCSNNIIT